MKGSFSVSCESNIGEVREGCDCRRTTQEERVKQLYLIVIKDRTIHGKEIIRCRHNSMLVAVLFELGYGDELFGSIEQSFSDSHHLELCLLWGAAERRRK